ncbi:hypothetical protein HY386_01535 [Candidatus Daviesbacteria bacterium]|nr:hypothetical protein [Candidatus Daviesbacteria bacterium]
MLTALKRLTLLVFFLIIACFALAEGNIVLGRTELEISGDFDQPFPPYRIQIGKTITLSVTDSSCNQPATLSYVALPTSQQITLQSQSLNVPAEGLLKFIPVIGAIPNLFKIFNVSGTSADMTPTEPGGYYLYAQCGSSGKADKIDIKFVSVYDPNPLLPPSPVSSSPPVSGGGFCNAGGGVDNGIDTAIGCVPTDLTGLIHAFLRLATGIAGGIAFILMVAGAFQMITSSGDPDTLKKGQDMFKSAVIGLLFIIFAVLLLQIIGVDILQIPGFQR